MTRSILAVYHGQKADFPETALSIEKTLFAAADKMRGAMDAGEYNHIAFGLLFLRYVSEAFDRRQAMACPNEVVRFQS